MYEPIVSKMSVSHDIRKTKRGAVEIPRLTLGLGVRIIALTLALLLTLAAAFLLSHAAPPFFGFRK